MKTIISESLGSINQALPPTIRTTTNVSDYYYGQINPKRNKKHKREREELPVLLERKSTKHTQ